jgi:PAS domain S-box-containing protein
VSTAPDPAGEPGTPARASTGDEVLDALDAVVVALADCEGYIAEALTRAATVRAERAGGATWAEIYGGAEAPLVLELMSAVLAALSDTGSVLRRAEARALYDEGLSMDKIARLFGVSRQRVSSLLSAPAGGGARAAGPRPGGGLALTDPEFRMVAEAVPHIVWVAGPDGATEYFNTQGVDYTGLPREAIYEWSWADLVHPDDVERTRAQWQDAVLTETPYELAYRIRRADGEFRWHAARALPVRGPDGRVTKWFGTATEVEPA